MKIISYKISKIKLISVRILIVKTALIPDFIDHSQHINLKILITIQEYLIIINFLIIKMRTI